MGPSRWLYGPRRLVRRVGHRGAALLLLGVLVALYGVGMLTRPLPDRTPLRLLLMIQDLPFWSCTWIVAGLAAIVCAFLAPGKDWPGFTALWLATVPWSLTFFVSWWPLGDNPRGWISAGLFAVFGALPLVLVGWPEPEQHAEGRRRPEGGDADE